MKYDHWVIAALVSYRQDKQWLKVTHTHTPQLAALSSDSIIYLVISQIYDSNTCIRAMVYVNIPGQKIVLSTFSTT